MNTKILLITIPYGENITEDVPIGISRVIEGIEPSLNCDIDFLDLYYYNLSLVEIENKIRAFSPQIIGFSAILTHSYAALKKLSIFIKDKFPNTIQVLGGEMAVISNIILQKTNIDFCVTGESEPTFSNLISKLEQNKYDLSHREVFKDIKGLAFLLNDIPYFIGYAEESANGMRQMNYDLISKYTNIEHYMPLVNGERFRRGINKYEIESFFSLFHPDNVKKKIANVSTSKGCVNKCTFCHRFFKGYKVMQPEVVINYIEGLINKYDIGLILFAEENFGLNSVVTDKIINYLKEKKINWMAGAVKAKTINKDNIKKWKDAGCVYIGFGIESCSQRMLDIMEKRTTVTENLNAIKLCIEYNLYSGILLLIGMPGETEETIEETINNLSTVIPDDINIPYEMCFNWFQAVPGTPGYEYARRIGFVGLSLDDEEKYIEGLYNVNANDIKRYLNFTDYEKEEIAYWKDYIFLELVVAYMRKHGILRTLKFKKANRYKYGLIYMIFPRKLRKYLLRYLGIVRYFGFKAIFRVIFKKLSSKKKYYFSNLNKSLREINKSIPITIRKDDIHTTVLRNGV
ncbi:MAG: radical SAM protein [Elusimicrobia bacterium]|nr:radical SAM protein [Elusimicrobiota bacterium]